MENVRNTGRERESERERNNLWGENDISQQTSLITPLNNLPSPCNSLYVCVGVWVVGGWWCVCVWVCEERPGYMRRQWVCNVLEVTIRDRGLSCTRPIFTLTASALLMPLGRVLEWHQL